MSARTNLEQLAAMGVEENWGRNHQYLKAYIENLLVRLFEEGKAMYYGTNAKIGALWFHSGLQSRQNDAVIYICATNVSETPFFALANACTSQQVRELCKLDDDIRIPLEKASFRDREIPNHVCFNLERFSRSPFKSLAVPTALLGATASETEFSQKLHLITTELRATGDRAAEDPTLAISVFNREDDEDRGTILIVLLFKVDSKQFVAVLQPTNNKDPSKYRYIIKDLLWVEDHAARAKLETYYNGARLVKKQEKKVNGKATLSFLAKLRPEVTASSRS